MFFYFTVDEEGLITNITQLLLHLKVNSFDMLGEAARTPSQADNYFDSYLNAIDEVGKINLVKNLSVKLLKY